MDCSSASPGNDDDSWLLELLSCHRSVSRLHFSEKYLDSNQNQKKIQHVWILLWPKDSTLPFPWANSKNASNDNGSSDDAACKVSDRKRQLETLVVSKGTRAKTRRTYNILIAYLDEYPHLRDLHQKLDQLFPGQVEFQLPPLHALSGAVYRHCTNVLEQLLESQSPMTFKIGFTHDPLWRWGNSLYGYSKSREQWTMMIVIYTASEPHSAAMLEAALIDKYQSILPEFDSKKNMFRKTHKVDPWRAIFPHSFWLCTSPCLLNLFHVWCQPRHTWLQKWKSWRWYGEVGWWNLGGSALHDLCRVPIL